MLEPVVAALQAGRPARAVALLEDLLTRDLPPHVEGPARGLHAQGLLAVERLDEAKLEVRQAMRLARQLDDVAAVEQLRALNGEIYGALAQRAEQAQLALAEAEMMARPLDELLAQATTPDEVAMVWVRKARGAELEFVHRAMAQVDGLSCGVRPKVLLRLELAERVPEQRAERLLEARDLADRAEEFQLLTAVAKAARRLDVDLPAPRFA